MVSATIDIFLSGFLHTFCSLFVWIFCDDSNFSSNKKWTKNKPSDRLSEEINIQPLAQECMELINDIVYVFVIFALFFYSKASGLHQAFQLNLRRFCLLRKWFYKTYTTLQFDSLMHKISVIHSKSQRTRTWKPKWIRL